ncbi:ABC-type dipeptide/oligopeptide/nickel transport system permease subunit [Thermocatellispora tengchongensis]|uniref:ABC-type dipeptide/oligopeptide/nickel transport system permease subunit n=1 Tax=Thermocatellispora tengchongensis TaxID=1073253 RepID=A0A840PAW5_9ACTN|nr:ABC transporter permease [Thermocatellispora tengchongensis]MBB5138534.1 ABC-type dipeptide/oligopeptide/nickel transport system permease subunit [Thermocatellispora tengchongensis]
MKTVTLPPDTALRRLMRRRRDDSLWSRLLRRRDVVLALAVLGALALVALLAPVIAPHDPVDQDLLHRLEGPSAAHWLGTDESGRDVLSRLLYGTRVSLGASLLAVAVAAGLGVPLGLLAGYLGGALDLALSRVADAVLSIPGLVLAIAIATALGPSLTNAMLAVGVVYAPGFYRVVRGSTITVRGQTYVHAAIVTGCSTWRIIGRHVLPNVGTPIIVKVFLTFGYAILAEAGLSFLGLGVQPPLASWGSMLKRAVRYLEQAPALVILPGLVILIAVLAFNTVGDGLRDALARRDREPS